MRRSVISCFFILATASSLPATAAAPQGWYRQVSVKYLYAGRVGGRAAVMINQSVNYGTCAGPEFTLEADSEYFPYMFAMLMNAYTKGTSINIYTDGVCTTQGLRATDVSVGDLP